MDDSRKPLADEARGPEEMKMLVCGSATSSTTIVAADTKVTDKLSNLAPRFHALFAGLERARGVYNNIDQTREDGKRTSLTPTTVRMPVTDELWEQHLAGKDGLGIIPIRDDSTVMFGAIDIDVYADLDHGRIAATLAKLGMPLVTCRSKSGGCHVYLFLREPQPAQKVIDKLRGVAAQLGQGMAEIFPKQSRIASEKDLGSWINMPFFDGDLTNRYAVSAQGDALSMEQFLALAESTKAGEDFFNKPLSASGTPKVAPDATKKQKRQGFMLPEVITDGQRTNVMKSYAGYLRHSGMSPEEILATLRLTNAKRCRPPLDDKPLADLAKNIGGKEPGAELEDGLIQRMAGAITATDSFARDSGGLLYHFEDGVYKATGRRFIERRVKQLCEQQAPKSWTPELAARVEAWIVVDAPELWECPRLDTLNCRNGLLNVESRILTPHSPEHLSAVQIAASFDPGAQCPYIDRFIQDVFPDDTQHLPYQVAAWLMLADTSIQKAVLLLGEGSNGKSVYLNLLLTFLGRENVSALSLHRIEGDKFAAARLVGKLCNIGTDLPTAALAGTSMFKALTGGDTITVERKFEASFEFRPFVRLVFSANSAPRSEDSTHGFFRRWLVVPFNRTFDESDPATVPRAVLDARLSEPGELSGLLNRALNALPVIRQGRFTESASTRAALDEFRRTTDPLAVWLEQQTVERPDAMVPKDRLRSLYGQVCQDSGRPIMPDTQFTAALKRLRPKVQPAQRRVDGKPTRVFIGLGLVTQAPEPGHGLF